MSGRSCTKGRDSFVSWRAGNPRMPASGPGFRNSARKWLQPKARCRSVLGFPSGEGVSGNRLVGLESGCTQILAISPSWWQLLLLAPRLVPQVRCNELSFPHDRNREVGAAYQPRKGGRLKRMSFSPQRCPCMHPSLLFSPIFPVCQCVCPPDPSLI